MWSFDLQAVFVVSSAGWLADLIVLVCYFSSNMVIIELIDWLG